MSRNDTKHDDSDGPSTAQSLAVATYNIRKCVGLDWRRRPDRILKVIRELDADVVALQEADRRFGTRLATLPIDDLPQHIGMHAVRLPADIESYGHHGNTILLREGIEATRVECLDLPSLEPRGALVADIAWGGTRIRIVGTHLGLRSADRRRQSETLLSELKNLGPQIPTMILGDFNEWREIGSAISELSKEFRPLSPALTFHTSMPIAPLDRIVVGDGMGIDVPRVHESETARRASDHLPLRAEIMINGSSNDAVQDTQVGMAD